MEELEMKISQLVDNELSDTEQVEVFGLLANDQKARQLYSKLLKLKREVSKHHYEVRTDLLPIIIPKSVQKLTNVNIYKVGFAFSSAAAIILMIFLLLGQNENKRTIEQFTSFRKKNETLEVEKKQLLNKSDYKPTLSKEAFPNKSKRVTLLTKQLISSTSMNINSNTERFKKFTQIPLANNVVINKNDFIGGQIVSN